MQFWMHAMKNYFVLNGRATRQQYWMFVLMNFVCAFGFGLVCGLMKMPALGLLFSVITFIPSITSQVRRAHDTNHKGWWLLVPVYGFCILFFKGDEGSNRWGNPPGAPTPTQDHVPLQKVG